MTLSVAVERHRCADRINAVLNDPDVRSWAANGTGSVDISQQVADDNNILLMGEHGGCMFYRIQPGIYEVHTQVERAGRGEWTGGLTAACGHWMFTRTDAFEVLTRVPHGHVAAKAAAIAAGMRHEFTRPAECLFRNRKVDVHIYSIRIQDWVQSAPWLVEIGAEFHDMLHAEAERLGVTDPPHDDDENHNRYVGAAVEMVRCGKLLKGVAFYNRWAAVSRHEPVRIVSQSPAVVQIDHGLHVTLDGETFRVTRP
jgi:hypothetical protein